jgi:hypothetical protein
MSEPALKLVPDPSAEPRPESVLLTHADSEQALSGFEAETLDKKSRFALRRLTALHAVVAALAIVAIVELVLLVLAGRQRQPAAAVPTTGTVVIESTPTGAALAINGADRGYTPSTLTLNPGDYTLSLTLGGVSRSIPLVVQNGKATEHVYLSGADAGLLTAAPATSVTQSVAPVPSASPLPAGAVGGWLNVSAPVDLELFEGGVLIGSSQTDRIMLPVGRHVIDAVNKTLGYETSTTVQVTAGSVARLKLEMPNATVNINAAPWADVVVDGKPLGPTPLGNVSLSVGSHDVVFTHPQLGERRQTVVVTLKGTNRISVNFNQR